MRLIDADALSARFEAMQEGANMRDHVYLMGVLSMIDNTPTIDAVPVVHAKWVFDRPYHYKCSACNNMWSSVAMVMSYCSNCGAKMDAKGDEESE